MSARPPETPAADAVPVEAEAPPVLPAPTLAEAAAATPLVGDETAGEQTVPVAAEDPVAPEFGQAFVSGPKGPTPSEPADPLDEVAVPGTDAAEANLDAPGVAADEMRGPPAVAEPTETEAGPAAPTALEAQVAEPEQPQAEAGGEARATAPDALRPEPQLSQAPAPPASAEAEAAVAWVAAWAEPIGAPSPPALGKREPYRRPAPAWWPPSLPSREAAGNLLSHLRLAARAVAAVALGYAGIVLTLAVLYRWVDPPMSTLMLGQRLAGTEIEQRWVPIERISPHLIKAVILSEDGGFCRHRGVDWAALGQAIENDRGGSTITMQVVKNLFLWPSRSYVRKAIEICLAYLVDLIWPKRRILEIYLNVAEWGDGVFGAEAAARQHFRKSAARLTPAEAALLAVALPNPMERRPGSPSPGMSRLAQRLLVRMATSRASLACVRMPRALSSGAPLVPRPRLTL